MKESILTLLSINLRTWFSAKGFWMVTLAALTPLIFTGAWVATNKVDVTATDVGWEGTGPFTEGDVVTFTARIENSGKFDVGEFEATLIVGTVVGNQLTPAAIETATIDGLRKGESRTITLEWTARPGVFAVLAEADRPNDLAEIEELNNQKYVPIAVQYRAPETSAAPAAPENLTGNPDANATADLRVASVTTPPLVAGENVTLRAVFENAGPDAATNATAVLRLVQMFDGTPFPILEESAPLGLAAGAESGLALDWRVREGVYWVEAYVDAGDEVSDPDGSSNREVSSALVQPMVPEDFRPPEPEERVTIKQFYLRVLSLLHLTIILPFIGLFYAAGVIADEKERGTLTYILTRPVARWTIPVVKFFASYLVAAAAVCVGIVLTYALLFGTTPHGDLGYLTTPLLTSLVALFVYGTFFLLLGVLVERPYLVGVAFVIGWETVAGNFVPWVQNLTLSHHVLNLVRGWPLDEGFQALPDGDGAIALRNVLVGGVIFLALAAYSMKRREFEA